MAIFGAAGKDPLLAVVRNVVDLILVELTMEYRFCKREHVVLVTLDVEHPYHVFSRNSCHKTLTCPNCVQELWVASYSKLDITIWH